MLLLRRVLFRGFSSNFKPGNRVRVRSNPLPDVFTKSPDEVNWEIVRNDLVANERYINKMNIDGFIIGACHKDLRLDIAKSYKKYLESQSIAFNDGSISKLLRLFFSNYRKPNQDQEFEKICVSEEDEAEIIQLSNSVMDKHKILEASLAENVILGLSLTREWRKCPDLLKHIEVLSTPSATTYCSIIIKALDENRVDIAWMLLNEMFGKEIVPSTPLLLKYFRMFQSDKEMTEKLLEAMSSHSLLLPEKFIENFRKVFSETRECRIAGIKRNGRCPSCSNNLPEGKLNEAEFNKLSDVFLNKVLIRRDVFIKTSPDELNRFRSFIEKLVPFDCVIDGLNVAYSHGTNRGVMMFVKNIVAVLKYFVERNQTCLVIGRRHMRHWPQDKMDFIGRNSHLFLADDISQDDPFMLYAALRSGSNTKIFSRDLMRGHSSLLDPESMKLFRRWQRQSQYSLITTLQNEKVLVQEPTAFELRAQKTNSYWHIPFTSENINFSYETFEPPSSWLCVKVG